MHCAPSSSRLSSVDAEFQRRQRRPTPEHPVGIGKWNSRDEHISSRHPSDWVAFDMDNYCRCRSGLIPAVKGGRQPATRVHKLYRSHPAALGSTSRVGLRPSTSHLFELSSPSIRQSETGWMMALLVQVRTLCALACPACSVISRSTCSSVHARGVSTAPDSAYQEIRSRRRSRLEFKARAMHRGQKQRTARTS